MASKLAWVTGWAARSTFCGRGAGRSLREQASPCPITLPKHQPSRCQYRLPQMSVKKSSETHAHEPQHRLTTGERARTVLHVCSTGTLCTASFRHGGHPFGSHVDFILDEWGRPIFLLAENATHSINLRHNPRCSLFAQPTESSGQAGQRVTLLGNLHRLEEPEVEEHAWRYIERFPHAEQALSYPAFAFYRMEIMDVYYVGGFGVTATWVGYDAYRQARPDPLALDAQSVVEAMNRDHKEDLLRFCRAFLEVEPEDCTITSLDRLGFDLRVRLCPCDVSEERDGREKGRARSSSRSERSAPSVASSSTRSSVEAALADPDCNEYREYRIAFRSAVKTTFDARSELVKAMQEAWEIERGMSELWDGALGKRPTLLYYDQDARREHSLEQAREEAEIVQRHQRQPHLQPE
ncbi:hypothetical protein CDCA_CDCA09G2631 [Cyanidium caldarium]|uniref:DUF2470 domain-containing protein n=1 Tax=Cyanidium caldarium TaxID=2771 RepID=A0AAV9IX08_CYACA|nr:hypothetical protein CDCA_CDCA09G2631 [Cyanidium caldarium]